MHIQQKGFTVLDQTIGVLQIRLSFADRLHFGTTQGDASLELLQKEVIVAGSPVVGCIALAGSHGIAGPGLLCGSGCVRGCDRMGFLAWHRGSSLKLSS